MPKDKLLQKIATRLAAAGYAPVSRQPQDKLADESPYFLCNEYWRLDNPRIRALVRMDLSRDSRIVVTFRDRSLRPFPLYLADLFRNAATPLSITLKGEDVCTRYNDLPYAADHRSDTGHRQLAVALAGKIRPFFFIDPVAGNRRALVLRGHAESDLAAIVAAEDKRAGNGHKPSSLERMTRIAAKQVAGISVLTLRVPIAGGEDKLEIQARRALSLSPGTQAQTVGFDTFIRNHEDILASHLRQCRNQPAAQRTRQP